MITPAVTTQATVSAADSARAKAKAEALSAIRRRQQREQQSLSHSDSAFFFAADTSFEQMCNGQADMDAIVAGHAWGRTSAQAGGPAAGGAARQPGATIEPTPRGTTALRPYADQTVGLTCLIVAVLWVVRSTSGGLLTDVAGFLNDSNRWRRLSKSAQAQSSISMLLLDAVYVLTASAMATQVAIVLSPRGIDEVLTFGLVAAGLCLFYLARHAADRLVAYAFMQEDRMWAVGLNRRASRAVIGVALTPLVLAMPFVSTAASMALGKVAVGIVCALTAWRVVKTLKINLTSAPSILYFILYLCIVEIAPLVCIARAMALSGDGA